MHPFDDVQLALFSGKGGVGKTTLACGYARRWARQFPQERVMLLSTDPAHSLGDVLQTAVENTPRAIADLANLHVRALDAKALLETFRAQYGTILELLVERGSFVAGDDLSPVWEMGWPGLDEFMALLEIEAIFREQRADRVVVDMAPSGHTLSLFSLMDFLDTLWQALEQFQAKHRYIIQSFAGRYTPDATDQFLADLQRDLQEGRTLLQDRDRTACWVVAIPEAMSFSESQRFVQSLARLGIPVGGFFLNHLPPPGHPLTSAQQTILGQFQTLAADQPIWGVPQQAQEPVGTVALDDLMAQVSPMQDWLGVEGAIAPPAIALPKYAPALPDFVAAGRRLVLVGGKGGVGKTTLAAALSWAMAERHPTAPIRVISIDPAHSLGDAFGCTLGHEPTALTANLTAQEVNAQVVLEQFRQDYLWELAAMMSGEMSEDSTLQIAYGPQAWQHIITQALPGIEEMLSLITVMELLEQNIAQLIVLDTAPTGHLLRFLAMPTALGDWLAWIFKLWMKYKDLVGRVEFMGRLRSLRQRVMQTQAKLKDPQHTEFIGVVQNQSAILAEARRLSQTLAHMGILQRYLVHNRYEPEHPLPENCFPAHIFPAHIIVRLANLPQGMPPLDHIKTAASLLLLRHGEDEA